MTASPFPRRARSTDEPLPGIFLVFTDRRTRGTIRARSHGLRRIGRKLPEPRPTRTRSTRKVQITHEVMVDRSQQGALIVKAVRPFSLFVLGTVTLLVPATVTAQTRPAAPRASSPAPRSPARPRSPVAVVDVSYIFKNHDGFKTAMDRMKSTVRSGSGDETTAASS